MFVNIAHVSAPTCIKQNKQTKKTPAFIPPSLSLTPGPHRRHVQSVKATLLIFCGSYGIFARAEKAHKKYCPSPADFSVMYSAAIFTETAVKLV